RPHTLPHLFHIPLMLQTFKSGILATSPPGSVTSRYGTMSSTILKSAKKTSYGQQVANRQRSENIYFPDALGSKRGEYGRVRAVVAQLSGGESEFWVADESAPHPAKTAPYGDPALRSTRISAPSRWALSFGEAPRCGWWWSWQIRMPLSHAPSKQEPPWFGPSF